MYAKDIKKLTKENTNFRTVLHTGKNAQIVAMCIKVDDEIGEETHPETDQLIFIVDGEGEAVVNGEAQEIAEHDVVFVPAGTLHNFINTGDEDLKLFTVYAPPEHPDGTIHKTHEDAIREEHE
ncbi:MAG TPA: cupin domain-containing protein [Patescibacteria group bacterium]|nr:cupin domain-containing protein [Patescibacteria group bacterium]